jgi:transposase-like protein
MPRRRSRAHAPRETDELRCPYCRSYRVTPAGQILAVGELIKEAHRCGVCKATFLIANTAIG